VVNAIGNDLDINYVYNDQVKIREAKNKVVQKVKDLFINEGLIIKDKLKCVSISKFIKFLYFFKELDVMIKLKENEIDLRSDDFPKFVYRESGSTIDLQSFCKYKSSLNVTLQPVFEEQCRNINSKLFDRINNISNCENQLFCQIDMEPISTFDACKQKHSNKMESKKNNLGAKKRGET
jgi:hypothetical protein